ncbi:MAG: hypothetical protein ACPG8W_19265, partial [Candidatus Promineifilaceae bacterium]
MFTTLVLLHLKYLRLATMLILFAAWCYVTTLIMWQGGLEAPAFGVFALMILATGLFYGGLGIVFASSFTMLVTTALFFRDQAAAADIGMFMVRWFSELSVQVLAGGLGYMILRGQRLAVAKSSEAENFAEAIISGLPGIFFLLDRQT